MTLDLTKLMPVSSADNLDFPQEVLRFLSNVESKCQIVFCMPGSVFSNSSAFREGSGLIALSNLHCNGSEFMLMSCPSTTTPTSCSHSQDIGVRCQLRTGAIQNANFNFNILLFYHS